MRSSSSIVAPSAIAILSTALLCSLSGTAVSQTATGSATPLPSITIVAPKQVARPQRPQQTANTVASRPTSPTTQTPSAPRTAHKPAPTKDSVMAKLAALEKTSSSCTDGCQTSFKYGNQPWNGCSTTGGEFNFSATCRNIGNYKTYFECKDARLFLGARNSEAWWYCSSLLAGGKFGRGEVSGRRTQAIRTSVIAHTGRWLSFPMSALGQSEKNSVRAYVFRFAPQCGRRSKAV